MLWHTMAAARKCVLHCQGLSINQNLRHMFLLTIINLDIKIYMTHKSRQLTMFTSSVQAIYILLMN